MDHRVVVHVLNSRKNLYHKVTRLTLKIWATALHNVIHVAVVAQLKHEVYVLSILKHVLKSHDVDVLERFMNHNLRKNLLAILLRLHNGALRNHLECLVLATAVGDVVNASKATLAQHRMALVLLALRVDNHPWGRRKLGLLARRLLRNRWLRTRRQDIVDALQRGQMVTMDTGLLLTNAILYHLLCFCMQTIFIQLVQGGIGLVTLHRHCFLGRQTLQHCAARRHRQRHGRLPNMTRHVRRHRLICLFRSGELMSR